MEEAKRLLQLFFVLAFFVFAAVAVAAAAALRGYFITFTNIFAFIEETINSVS
jgi:hypothetical protein